jgi:hypothetical protein
VQVVGTKIGGLTQRVISSDSKSGLVHFFGGSQTEPVLKPSGMAQNHDWNCLEPVLGGYFQF